MAKQSLNINDFSGGFNSLVDNLVALYSSFKLSNALSNNPEPLFNDS